MDKQNKTVRLTALQLSDKLGIGYSKIWYRLKVLANIENSRVKKLEQCYELPEGSIELLKTKIIKPKKNK